MPLCALFSLVKEKGGREDREDREYARGEGEEGYGRGEELP